MRGSKGKTREHMKRLHEGTSSNFSNISDENIPIDIDVENTPNLTNKNVQHTPIEMIMTNILTSPNAPNETSQVEMMNAHDVSNKNIEHACTSTSPRIIHGNPKFLIGIDENILKPMHDKMLEINCRRIFQNTWNKYFENLNQNGRCQLLVEMV